MVSTIVDRTAAALAWWDEVELGPTDSVGGTGAVQFLEQRVAGYTGAAFALALPSGTASLRTALAAVRVGPGDEVIVPALDWPAAASAVRSRNAIAVPADVDAATATIAPDAVERAITPRTRAVIVTHLFGYPADTAAFRDIADAYGISVVEDCAQALGARHRDRHVGTLGDVGCFSFGPGKLINAGEGGALITSDETVFEAAVRASQHPYRQVRSGIAFPSDGASAERIHPIAAIVALYEFEHVGQLLAARRNNAARTRAALRDSRHYQPLPAPTFGTHAWHLIAALHIGQYDECDFSRVRGGPLSIQQTPCVVVADRGRTAAPNAAVLAKRLVTSDAVVQEIDAAARRIMAAAESRAEGACPVAVPGDEL